MLRLYSIGHAIATIQGCDDRRQPNPAKKARRPPPTKHLRRQAISTLERQPGSTLVPSGTKHPGAQGAKHLAEGGAPSAKQAAPSGVSLNVRDGAFDLPDVADDVSGREVRQLEQRQRAEWQRDAIAAAALCGQ